MSIKKTGKSITDQLRDFRAISRDLPMFIGTEAVRFFKDTFNKQGWTGDSGIKKWKARNPKAKRNKRRKILTNTGALKRSIRITQKTANSVTIGTNLPYAKVHNEGFRGVQYVKPHKRTATIKMKWKNSYTGRNITLKDKGKRHNVRAYSRKLTIPQRQFIGKSAIFERRIIKQIELKVKRALDAKF